MYLLFLIIHTKKCFMKRLIFFSLLIIFSSTVLFAQEIVDTSIINKIRDEGLNRSQIRFIAHNITDVSGSRLTNSPGFRRAADWIVSTLKQWGLSDAKLESWGEFGYGWSVDKSYAAI